ncbi:MAG TPA: roadblock/LC7 domain-containing protein [Gemmatimonadales bacterium]|nr:roadblock/LC7 domain-containing protein [Gemmatimonadales bacterium]
MTGLAGVIRGLAAREGVQAAVLLSADGLPIEHASAQAIEADTVAALAATLARHAQRMGEGAARGELRTTVLEFDQGSVVLARVGGGDWLAVLSRPDADIGPLLYDLRHHRAALTPLL